MEKCCIVLRRMKEHLPIERLGVGETVFAMELTRLFEEMGEVSFHEP